MGGLILTMFKIFILFCCALTNIYAEDAFKNISCVLITSKGEEKSLIVDNPEATEIDLYLHPDKMPPTVRCSLAASDADQTTNGKLSFKVASSRGTLENSVMFTNTSIADMYEATLNISDENLTVEHDILPYHIELRFHNKSVLLTRGTVIHLEILPSFTLSPEYERLMESEHINVKWTFLPTICNSDILLIIPEKIDNRTYEAAGMPIGTLHGSDSLKLIKWEHISLPFVRNGSNWNSVLLEHFLLLHSKNDIYLVPSVQDNLHGNATRNLKNELNWGLDISVILSISSSKDCAKSSSTDWYDLVIVFRFHNTTIGVMLSSDPYWRWDVYLFPDWLTPANNLTSQLDVQTQTISILVTIGEPLSSAVLVYKVRCGTKELVLHAVPFTFSAKLDDPVLELIPSIPALVAYDQKELWFSVDGGQNFQQIFISNENSQIQKVGPVGTLHQELAIVSETNIHVYNSRGLHQSNELSTECPNSSHMLWRINKEGSIKLYCNTSLSNLTMEAKTLNFTILELVLPSLVAEMRSEYEVSMHLPNVYHAIPEFRLNPKNLCFIPRYPAIHLCDIEQRHQTTSLLMSTNSKIMMKTFRDCLLQFSRIDSIRYTIQALAIIPDLPCRGWSENDIGKSLQIFKLNAVCWIYWLSNDTTAEASCFSQGIMSNNIALKPGEWVLLDSRGSERCYKAQAILNGTSASSPLALQVNLSASYLQHTSFIRLSETVGRIANNSGSWTVQLFSEANMTVFSYICVISKQIQKSDVIAKVSSYAQTCHFNISSESTMASEVFLDANDQLNINITAVKLTSSVPYWDEVPPINIELSDRQHVKLQAQSYLDASTRRINLFLMQKPLSNGTTILKIHTPVQPVHCNNIISKVTIYGTCPPKKRLLFEYPMVFSRETWLFGNPVDADDIKRIANIPYNYQPPSYRGKAIPMTSHIYNADPSQPMYRARYKITRELAKYKQCKGRLNRLSCGCTDDMTFSSSPFHSDCIQRVYKVDYHETFQPRLYLLDENSTKTWLEFPYYLTEVNNRSDYAIQNPVHGKHMSVPAESRLEFTASGLYHFKINVVKSGYTFCDLEAYFVVFVTDEPLPDPAQDLVRAMTSFCFGSILLTVFLLNYYHPNRK